VKKKVAKKETNATKTELVKSVLKHQLEERNIKRNQLEKRRKRKKASLNKITNELEADRRLKDDIATLRMKKKQADYLHENRKEKRKQIVQTKNSPEQTLETRGRRE